MRAKVAEFAFIFRDFNEKIRLNFTVIPAPTGAHESTLFIMKLEILK